ncbi:MAG: hypothetical protein Q7U16_13130 [Agitococcus sp.]|nr:hypothetical protein [Agitococcus sp.]
MITDANNGSLAISDDKGCSTIPQAMGAALRLFREQSGLSLSEVEQIKARIPRPSGRGQASFC